MKLEIWYMKPEFFRDGIMGYDWLVKYNLVPDVNDLTKTHVLLREIEAGGLDNAYSIQQGENWSPNGEARPLIEEKGLKHTSMSVGDIIRYPDTADTWIVNNFGFKKLETKPKCPFIDPSFSLDRDTPCPVCGMTGTLDALWDDKCVGGT